MQAGTPEAERLVLLSLRQVIERVSLQKTAIYDLIHDGAFPRPIQIRGANGVPMRCARWSSADIDAWIRAQLAAAENGKEADK